MAERPGSTELIDADAGELRSFDPATGELVGRVPVTPPEGVAAVAEEAARIQAGWALVPLPERLRVVGRAAEVLLDRREELERLITRENGKTLLESTTTEIGPSALGFDWVARFGLRFLSPERVPNAHPVFAGKRHRIVYPPLGVIGIVAPWNYPFSLPAIQVAFSVAAGNAVVLKPSEYTPLVGDAVASVFRDAGLPDGVLRVVHGAGATGAALVEAPAVRKIFFTGSVATGRRVARAAAKHGKEVLLELGGKDPAIVCADANLERAVAGALWAASCNAGQTCAGVERVYVDRRVHDAFLDRLVAAARRVRAGSPFDPDTQIGPMNNAAQYEAVVAQLEEAVSAGARVLTGGPVELPGLSGRFIAPAVLTGVDHSMRLMREETFGPLIPVMAFDDEEEAVRLANDGEFGLGASVWSRDIPRARAIAARLDAGMVWINDHAYTHGAPQAPWGGVKSSGTGVSHSKFSFYENVEKRLVAEDRGWLREPGWWYPYDDVKRRGFVAMVESVVGDGVVAKIRTAAARRGDLVPYLRSLLSRRA